MTPAGQRPPARRLLPWAAAVDTLGLCAFLIVRFGTQDREAYDERRMDELRAAELTPAAGTRQPGTGWPQWRGPRRDGSSPATDFVTDWPEEGAREKFLAWEHPLGGGFSSVVVADGRAVTMYKDGNHEVIICRQADTGAELWRHRYPCDFDGDNWPGPRSTPSVDGDRVYAVGAAGAMHCLNAADGRVVWERNLLADFGAENLRWGVAFSPLVVGDLVYTIPGGPGGNSVVALDKHNGQVRWKSLDDRAGYSSPVYATPAGTPQVIFLTGQRLVGLDPDTGALLWGFPYETDHGVNSATPVVAGDYVFISSGYGKGCSVVRIGRDAQGRWEATWVYKNNPRMQNHFASCVLHGDHLYGFSNETLTCLEFRTGRVRWRESGLGKGSLLLAAGHLFVLAEDGRLILARASAEKFRPLSQLRALRGDRCWSTPALADGRLYLRDERQIVCLDLRAGRPRAGGE